MEITLDLGLYSLCRATDQKTRSGVEIEYTGSDVNGVNLEEILQQYCLDL